MTDEGGWEEFIFCSSVLLRIPKEEINTNLNWIQNNFSHRICRFEVLSGRLAEGLVVGDGNFSLFLG